MKTTHQTAQVTYSTGTHSGTRKHNEDSVTVHPDHNLFVVADGAGGHNAGDVASSLAASSIIHYFDETNQNPVEGFDVLGLPLAAKRLSAALHRANEEIVSLAQSANRYQGMGTTVVAAHFTGNHVLHLCHVGDSRCYRLREKHFELLTRDHSLANDVLELTPTLDEDKASEFPANVVTRALGMSPRVRVSTHSSAAVKGDLYLLCSDGLTNTLSEKEIVAAMSGSPEEIVEALLKQSDESSDNVAVVVVRCQPWDSQESCVVRRGPYSDADNDYPEIVMTSGSSPDISVTRLGKDAFSSGSAARVFEVPNEPHSGSFELRNDNICETCGAVFSGSPDMCPHCALT